MLARAPNRRNWPTLWPLSAGVRPEVGVGAAQAFNFARGPKVKAEPRAGCTTALAHCCTAALLDHCTGRPLHHCTAAVQLKAVRPCTALRAPLGRHSVRLDDSAIHLLARPHQLGPAAQPRRRGPPTALASPCPDFRPRAARSLARLSVLWGRPGGEPRRRRAPRALPVGAPGCLLAAC